MTVDGSLELAQKLTDRAVVEREDLRQQHAGHVLGRIDPEVGIVESRPSEASRGAAPRHRFSVDQEPQAEAIDGRGKKKENDRSAR